MSPLARMQSIVFASSGASSNAVDNNATASSSDATTSVPSYSSSDTNPAKFNQQEPRKGSFLNMMRRIPLPEERKAIPAPSARIMERLARLKKDAKKMVTVKPFKVFAKRRAEGRKIERAADQDLKNLHQARSKRRFLVTTPSKHLRKRIIKLMEDPKWNAGELAQADVDNILDRKTQLDIQLVLTHFLTYRKNPQLKGKALGPELMGLYQRFCRGEEVKTVVPARRTVVPRPPPQPAVVVIPAAAKVAQQPVNANGGDTDLEDGGDTDTEEKAVSVKKDKGKARAIIQQDGGDTEPEDNGAATKMDKGKGRAIEPVDGGDTEPEDNAPSVKIDKGKGRAIVQDGGDTEPEDGGDTDDEDKAPKPVVQINKGKAPMGWGQRAQTILWGNANGGDTDPEDDADTEGDDNRPSSSKVKLKRRKAPKHRKRPQVLAPVHDGDTDHEDAVPSPVVRTAVPGEADPPIPDTSRNTPPSSQLSPKEMNAHREMYLRKVDKHLMKVMKARRKRAYGDKVMPTIDEEGPHPRKPVAKMREASASTTTVSPHSNQTTNTATEATPETQAVGNDAPAAVSVAMPRGEQRLDGEQPAPVQDDAMDVDDACITAGSKRRADDEEGEEDEEERKRIVRRRVGGEKWVPGAKFEKPREKN
ncbi:hypothetical protein CC2G_013861 [Coprinopsis cinerea AmutBmut pab1-1]|nr:hypothetical protein CC2G_013861 [Coprinopsis cinerea AmutBmut pab1-1]